jgi:tetratricopeptide (TPR) repeat protein/tRNA A-37 threonylcarbamoyl transferase component Bud32
MELRDQLAHTLGSAYTLERELGGGGMSRVFVANEQRLNRQVVIKVLSPELAAGVNAERFEREIQVAASLQQANIVPILSAGDTNGLPFYTMPFVDGESLRARLASEGPMPVGAVTNVLRDVARALAYAHERGVVHRDIKPDNVLLSGGTAVVTDFGIAKALSAARTQVDRTSELTQFGTSIGTPAYMSPEQAAGDPSVDHRADVYSFGCMAYELLAGRVPFDGMTPARMLAAHISEAPTPVGQLRPDVPAPLEQLVMRCLEKDPDLRPRSGGEIAQILDAIVSGTGSMASAAGTQVPLTRALGLYAAALVTVAIIARAAIVALDVPGWVLPGAVGVVLLILPVILATWYVQREQHRAAITTPARTPGRIAGPVPLAMRLAPHLTWRRAWSASATAMGTFVAVVVGFVVLRALGIGPAGSLLAAGALDSRDRLIVTSFTSPDTSLSTLVQEAVRTNLGQSRVVSIMPPVAIAAALERMQRPATTELTFGLAREIAQREGVKAIVDGAVRSVAGGYVLSLRLVSVDSVRDLAGFQETAEGPQGILEAIDKLTRNLRGRIGESLRDVRASPPLEQVTTGSLEALRIYAEAARAIDMGGNPMEAAERLREVVRIDSTFAMAWRKLGVALSNAGRPRIQVDSALEMAYRYRDRLTERERLMAVGTYYHLGPGRHRGEAIRSYEALLAIDPTENGAANNLGSILTGRREYARAESLFRSQIDAGRATAQQYTNLFNVLHNSGQLDEAARLNQEFATRFQGAPSPAINDVSLLYARNELDSMERALRRMTESQNPLLKVNGFGGLASYSLLRGRIDDVQRHGREAQRLADQLGAPSNPFTDSLQRSFTELFLLPDTAAAVRRVDAAVASTNLTAMPFEQRQYVGLAFFYAKAGKADRARDYLSRFESEMPDTLLRRIREPDRHAMLGMIAAAEGRTQDAVRELWRADTTYDGPDGNCSICLLDEIGWVWSSVGAADSAIHYFERYLSTPYNGRYGMDAAQKGPMLKRLGELYEAKGDITNAALRYREFLDLWDRPHPSLRPMVEDARYRLSRLANVERR